MKISKWLIPILLFTTFSALGQEKIAWSSDYKLKPQEFKGTAPNSGTMQTIYGHSIIEYGFMNYQVFFSNLNSNVKCSFLPSVSWLDIRRGNCQTITVCPSDLGS